METVTSSSSSSSPCQPVMMAGVFTVNKIACDVVFDGKVIKWAEIILPNKGSKGSTSGCLTVKEIYASRIRRLRRVDHPGPGVPLGFTLFYSKPKDGSTKLRPKQVSFDCRAEEVCQDWAIAILEALKAVPGRPNSVIVLLAKYGNEKKYATIYRDTVSPLFSASELSADVVGVKDKSSCQSTVYELCLTGVDGIVCIGPDSLVNETINTLIIRTQEDFNIDLSSMLDTDRKLHPTIIPIGLIPTGPTDIIAHTSQGISDIVTSALNIIYGSVQTLDTFSIHCNNKLQHFGFGALYGFGGEVLMLAVHNKWLGSKRIETSIVTTILKLRAFDCEISYLPCPGDNLYDDRIFCRQGCVKCRRTCSVLPVISAPPPDADPIRSPSSHVTPPPSDALSPPKQMIRVSSAPSSTSPQHRSGSARSVVTVTSLKNQGGDNISDPGQSRPSSSNLNPGSLDYTDHEGNTLAPPDPEMSYKFLPGSCEDIDHHDILLSSRNSSAQSSDSRTNPGKYSKNMRRAESQALDQFPAEVCSNPHSDWKTISGSFINVSCMAIPCLSDLLPNGLAPYTHLSDGAMTLTLVRNTSRKNFIRYLQKYGNPKFPFVENHRVSAVRFTATNRQRSESMSDVSSCDASSQVTMINEAPTRVSRRASVWNVDSEIMGLINVEFRVHHKLVKIFGKGIPDRNDEGDLKCGCLPSIT